jgi:STE24 endopeptidase
MSDFYEDPETRARAVRYSRIREWLVLVGMVWSLVTNALALTTGSSARLRAWAKQVAPPRLGPVMPYAAVGTIVSALASLPLSYLGGYEVERRFGLSEQTRRSWLADQLKALGVGLALGAPIAQGVYWIIRRYPRRWWAILSALTIPLTVVLVNLAPVLILPLFNKYEPLKDDALVERIRALAAREGVTVSAVLQMNMSKQTKKPNAFFTGLGNTKRIVVADTLLDNFSADEVEVVLAHELAHQVHHDLWKGIAVGALTTVVTAFLVSRLAPRFIGRFGDGWELETERGVGDVAALPLLGLLAGGTGLGLAPLVNGWVRRFVEHAADAYALRLTGNAEAFVGSMEKLGRLSLADPNPPVLVKHLLYDHPPIGERIAFGRRGRRRDPRVDSGS